VREIDCVKHASLGTLSVLVLSTAIASASFGVMPSSAFASTAQITRAETNPTWTRGSIAFSATWDECTLPGCSWLPVATVQPALPSYSCRGNEALDSDPNTSQIWSGGNRTSNGTATADLMDVPILNGVQGQRLCVSVIRTERIRDPVCVAQAPIFGYDPNTCPYINQTTYRVLATALLTVTTPPAPPAPPAPPPVDPPPVDPGPSAGCLSAQDELAAAKSKLKKLKSRDAKPKAIKRAKRAVKAAQETVAATCGG
jgi:hypothetical protein